MAFLGFEIPNARMWRELDWTLMLLAMALVAFGLVTLYGATYDVSSHSGYVTRQVVWVGLGVVALFVILFVNVGTFERYAWYFYGLSLGLLVFVFTQPEINGAHSWIILHPRVRLQPSEFAKIAVVLVSARVLTKYTPMRGANVVRGLAALAAVSLPPFVLIVLQPDPGTGLIFILTILGMVWAAGARRRLFLAFFLWGTLAVLMGYPFLKPHQKKRIEYFLNPEEAPLGQGYQIIQSQIAQGSGRVFGKGWGKGTATGLRFLPEYHNDFIFPSLGEQFGLVGSALALGFFVTFIARCYDMAQYARDRFGAYVVAGLTTVIAAHVVVNLGMALGLLPVMGLPLPFFSYGGSFMLTNFMILGLILNFRMRRFMFQ